MSDVGVRQAWSVATDGWAWPGSGRMKQGLLIIALLGVVVVGVYIARGGMA